MKDKPDYCIVLANLSLFLLLIVPTFATIQEDIAAKYPLEYYINDFTGTLSYDEMHQIELVMDDINQQGVIEFAIVLVPNVSGADVSSVSFAMANGHLGAKDKNNGLLLLLSLSEQEYRFEVGRGIEDKLPDITTARIARTYLVPALKESNYAQGLLDVALEIRAIVNNQTVSSTSSAVYDDTSSEPLTIIIIMVILIIVILISAKYGDKGTGPVFIPSGGGNSGGFGGFGRGGSGGGSFGGGGSGGKW